MDAMARFVIPDPIRDPCFVNHRWSLVAWIADQVRNDRQREGKQ